ncbi:MAG: glycosyltransferase family 39 protein [Chloroflexi bacterium]|nr:glycosyltransferase family 39 protein [Chloroflexota bacterium]
MRLRRERGEWAWLLPRILVPFAAVLVEGFPSAVGAVAVQECGLWLARRFGGKCNSTSVSRVFVAAYAIRAVFILPTHYVNKLANGNGALFQDDYTSDLVGEWLVRIGRGDGISIFPGHQYLLESVYPYVVMGIYSVLGFSPLVPKLLSGVIGALTAVLMYEIGRQAFGRRVGLMAAAGAAVIPTLVVFSSVTLKEPLVLFVAVLGLWTLQQIILAPPDGPRLLDMLLLMLGVVLLSLDLRSTLSLILVGLTTVVMLARSRIRPHALQLGLASAALVVLVGGGLSVARSRISDRPLRGVVEDVVLQIRHRRAQEAASARSQIRPELDSVTATGSALPQAEAASDAEPFSLFGDIVEPLAFAALAPAPWQARSNLELGASAEMVLVWYPLLLASVFARPTGPQTRLYIACLIGYALANWFVLAASEGNLGNLVRHRMMLAPVFLVLGCAGLEAIWERAGRPLPRHLRFAARVPVDMRTES